LRAGQREREQRVPGPDDYILLPVELIRNRAVRLVGPDRGVPERFSRLGVERENMTGSVAGKE
jgi:hypothetical protein